MYLEQQNRNTSLFSRGKLFSFFGFLARREDFKNSYLFLFLFHNFKGATLLRSLFMQAYASSMLPKTSEDPTSRLDGSKKASLRRSNKIWSRSRQDSAGLLQDSRSARQGFGRASAGLRQGFGRASAGLDRARTGLRQGSDRARTGLAQCSDRARTGLGQGSDRASAGLAQCSASFGKLRQGFGRVSAGLGQGFDRARTAPPTLTPRLTTPTRSSHQYIHTRRCLLSVRPTFLRPKWKGSALATTFF